MKPLAYLNLQKGNAKAMMEAFAEGSGAEITTKLEFQPGREAVFWGVDRLTLPLWRKVQETRTPFWYVDNGYFRSRYSGGDHYRVTRNAMQCKGDGTSDGARWRALDIALQPWRADGRHILIACQSDFWHERHGHGSAAGFAERVRKEMHTKRPIIVRGKPIGGHVEPPLDVHLKDCWAVVTHSSMAAAEALLAGVPAFVLAPSAMVSVTLDDLSLIEFPACPSDRERWASVLADNQWRLSEIKAGVAWKALQ